MLIDSIDSSVLYGKKWINGSFSEDITIELSSLSKYICHFQVFYCYFSKRYIGFVNYVINALSGIDYIKYNLNSFLDNKKQQVYNKQKFAALERIELLRSIIDLGFRTQSEGFMTLDLMTELYSLRWVAHPESHEQENQLQLFVDSFLDSGEIRTINNINYFVTGKAINTLSKYEEQERRHSENIRLQNRLVILTCAIVGVGLLQALVTYIK